MTSHCATNLRWFTSRDLPIAVGKNSAADTEKDNDIKILRMCLFAPAHTC